MGRQKVCVNRDARDALPVDVSNTCPILVQYLYCHILSLLSLSSAKPQANMFRLKRPVKFHPAGAFVVLGKTTLLTRRRLGDP